MVSRLVQWPPFLADDSGSEYAHSCMGVAVDWSTHMIQDEVYYSPFHDAWFFYDECGDTMGPYPSEKKANKALANYTYWLSNGPKWWWDLLWQWGGRYVPF